MRWTKRFTTNICYSRSGLEFAAQPLFLTQIPSYGSTSYFKCESVMITELSRHVWKSRKLVKLSKSDQVFESLVEWNSVPT